MPLRTPPPEQLDIPLVWDRGEGRRDHAGDDPPPGAPTIRPPAGTWRLWLAVLVDAGLLVLAVVAASGLAAALGAELVPGQVVLAGVAGGEVASVVALGCLWGWRATPGMLLVGICFAAPISWSRVIRLWFSWVLSMLLGGVPLVLPLGGESVAERLAGGSLSFRSVAEGA